MNETKMKTVEELRTNRTSPLLDDDPPRPRTQFEALMDGAREAMVEPDPLRGHETGTSAQATAAILAIAVKHAPMDEDTPVFQQVARVTGEVSR